MKRKTDFPTVLPPRRELSDTPVKLCNEIARLFRFRMRQGEGQEGVMSQPGAHLVMSVLAIHDGINQREVVRLTHLRPPTVSVILRKMEAEELVECQSDPNDQRAKLVRLSAAGRLRDMEHIEQIRSLDAVAMKGLTAEEMDTLMRILPRIRDNLLMQNDEEKGERKQK